MRKIKQLSFEGQTIYCGLDVHKSNWKVSARMNDVVIAAFSQDPDPQLLKKHFEERFPHARLKVVYEAGFCGFGIQRSLSALQVDCIVANPADVPKGDKDRKRKTDKRDAKKLSIELANGNLKGIYVPDQEMEQARSLVRERYKLVQDQSRSIGRIKHLLLCHGLKINAPSERMSLRLVNYLRTLDCGGSSYLKMTLTIALEEYVQLRKLVAATTVLIRTISKQAPFAAVQKVLQSTGGIGLIAGMVLQTEIMDISRFSTLDKLCDYVGFVPDIYSTNDKTVVRGISFRANPYLREVLIEASWILIRKDPAMLMKYTQYCKRMNSNKAIIRIAKHLLARIRHLWQKAESYQVGMVG